jgi:ATP-dependent exoDNAse (exonuclease V) alpha subunit
LFLPINRIFFSKNRYFLTDTHNDTIFVLKGYAGTGKTTVISTIVNNLLDINEICFAGANGRAAKVIANYSNKPFTIHKKSISKEIFWRWSFYFATK